MMASVSPYFLSAKLTPRTNFIYFTSRKWTHAACQTVVSGKIIFMLPLRRLRLKRGPRGYEFFASTSASHTHSYTQRCSWGVLKIIWNQKSVVRNARKTEASVRMWVRNTRKIKTLNDLFPWQRGANKILNRSWLFANAKTPEAVA